VKCNHPTQTLPHQRGRAIRAINSIPSSDERSEASIEGCSEASIEGCEPANRALGGEAQLRLKGAVESFATLPRCTGQLPRILSLCHHHRAPNSTRCR